MDLRSHLDQLGVEYQWHHHDAAYTARSLAQTEHVSGKKVIKPVVVNADGHFVLCALPANEYIDLEQLRAELDAEDTQLASEPQLGEIFRDCELGAEPPIGGLYGLPTLMDRALADQDRVVFQAGTHEDAVQMSMQDYMRLAKPRVVRFGRAR